MRKNIFTHIVVIVMLLIVAGQCILSMRQKSPVCDEVSHHIGIGYSFLKTGDFRLNATSPPLTVELAAIPLLFLNPHLPLEDKSWDDIDRGRFGFQFLYRYNDNADQLVFFSRLPMVLLSVLCALLVFIFARELYGVKSGIFAMFLYTFSPTILAYSRLVTPDIGATFFILLAIYRFYKFIRKPKLNNIVLAGIVLGLALSTKLSALILLPLFLAVSVFKAIFDKKPRYLTAIISIIILSFVVIFASYLGEVKPLLKNDIDVEEKIAYIEKGVDALFRGDNTVIKEKVIDFALNKPIPLAAYIMNILAETNMVFVKDRGGLFLLGERSPTGWWYYYIVAFLLKTPIPTIIFLFLSLLLFRRVRPAHIWGERMILLFLASFVIASLLTKLQLSIRYILPIYPVIFIYASRLMNLKIKKQVILNLFIIALSLWYLLGSCCAYPDYIPYFNSFAGGPDNGYRCLRDTNAGYGQDLPALSKYMKDNGIKEVKLSYFGTADPEYYGIKYKQISKEEELKPNNEVYVISANYIDTVTWKDSVKPTAKAGYSIFIYDFRER